MLLKQLLLLLYAAVCSCAPDDFIFYTGKLEDKSTTQKIYNRLVNAPPVWKTLTYDPLEKKLYGTRDVEDPTVYAITDLGKDTETTRAVGKYYGTVRQILPTYITGLSLFVLSDNCMTLMVPAVSDVYYWAGNGCDNIADNGKNLLASFIANRLGSFSPFRGAALSNDHFYVYALPDTSVIHTMAIQNNGTYRHTVEGHEGSHLTMMEYAEGYLYFSTEEAKQMITRVNEGLLNTAAVSDTNNAVAGETVISQRSSLLYPVGPFSSAVLPEITGMHYFKNNYMFIVGASQYTSPDRTTRNVTLIRLLHFREQKVYEVCVDPDGWDIYTRLNPDNNCTMRIPTIVKSQLLSYKPGFVNLHLYSKLTDTSTGLDRFVPYNWQFEYRKERDLPTTATAPTTTPTTSQSISTGTESGQLNDHPSGVTTQPTNGITTQPTNSITTQPTNGITTATVPTPLLPTAQPTTAQPPRTESGKISDQSSDAAVTGSSWSGLIYGALVTALLLVTGDGAFIY